jgi:hypothetical protein
MCHGFFQITSFCKLSCIMQHPFLLSEEVCKPLCACITCHIFIFVQSAIALSSLSVPALTTHPPLESTFRDSTDVLAFLESNIPGDVQRNSLIVLLLEIGILQLSLTFLSLADKVGCCLHGLTSNTLQLKGYRPPIEQSSICAE